jgi:hypothetical protein
MCHSSHHDITPKAFRLHFGPVSVAKAAEGRALQLHGFYHQNHGKIHPKNELIWVNLGNSRRFNS